MLEYLGFGGSIIVLLLFLAAALVIDLKTHRIPNPLSFGLILTGLLLGGLQDAGLFQNAVGAQGFLQALGGLGIAFGIFLPFYLFRGMGAGDVKLMAGIGTFMGPFDTLLAVGASLVAGALMGFVILVAKGGLADAWRRWFMLLRYLTYQPPEQGEAAAIKFPYAIAIATGTGIALWSTAYFQQLGFFTRGLMQQWTG